MLLEEKGWLVKVLCRGSGDKWYGKFGSLGCFSNV
jgi:hypothetical protein